MNHLNYKMFNLYYSKQCRTCTHTCYTNGTISLNFIQGWFIISLDITMYGENMIPEL